MKITIKNLQQQTFVVEIDEKKTILNLKEAIEKLKGTEYDVERQKLIYAGIILDDDKQISSYNMDEKKFVVVMVKRDMGNVSAKTVKTKNLDSVDTAANSEKKTEIRNEQCLNSEEETALKEGEKEHNTSTIRGTNVNIEQASRAAESNFSVSLQSQAESNLLTGQEYAKTVQSIVEMGYTKEMVERAMVASFNNPERAVEYLISGIPETEAGLITDIVTESLNITNDNSSRQSTGRNTSTITSTNSSESPFEFLRNQPQFLQMRSLIHGNPELLNAVLQQIRETNPALLQLIYENQEAFLTMLNQPVDGTSAANPITSDMLSNLPNIESNPSANLQNNQESTSENVSRLNTEGNGSQRSSMPTIRLSPQDEEAIERLKALGFPEVLVVQAYFACEKNEQLAANFLLSSSFDD